MSVTSGEVDVLGLDGGEATTVLDRLVEELDPVELHAVAVTATRGSTHYVVVAKTGRNSGGDVIDLRTVVVDLGEESVRVTDNGMWLPYDPDVVTSVLRSLARTHTDMTDEGDERRPTAAFSAVETPAEELLSTPVEDEEEAPDGWGVDYGNGQGEPPEAHDLVERLAEADLRTDRFSRLDFGSKTPWERYAERPVDGLLGNYGVETLETGRLIVIDVDYPEALDVELPETFRVSSANGDDDRAHYYYALPDGTDKSGLHDYYGSWALKPDFGDVWIAGEYVVGPGSRLDDGGIYDVVDDVPIATIEPSELMSIVPRSVEADDDATGVDEETEADAETDVEDDRDGGDDADDDDRGDEDGDEEADRVECDACGDVVDREEASLTDRGDGPVYVCEVCHE